jgi:bifunctional UDP-N-acetylglucosamine pyrophosphorylase/glucosamine-1-phosphate N-acetyltransferase
LTHKKEIEHIIEYKDATNEERQITLCNAGIMIVRGKELPKLLEKLDNKNAGGEYYLTDIVKIAKAEGLKSTFTEAGESEVMGINSKLELSDAEKIMQNRLREEFMTNGVTMTDPSTVYFSYDTEIGKDVVIQPNVFFGKSVKIKNNVEIKAYSYIEGAVIEDGVSIGPFARIRPGTHLSKDVHVGNFVEIKNSELKDGVKVGHLSYIGDAEIGENVNIGAGTITCNYDGVKKHKTKIGKNAFIGSNTALIAPVTIGEGALIGAGSTINKDVKKDALAVTRAPQVEIEGLAKEKLHKKESK